MRTDSGLQNDMTAYAAHCPTDTLETRLASRGDLTAFLMQLAAEIGADSYMLVAIVHSEARNDARILASNWIFDAIELIGKRLVSGQTITDSEVGLGDRIGAVAMGTAQGVGSAASLVVSAPIAVFDPNTRRTYTEQLDRFGRAVDNTVQSVTQQ